MTDQCKCQPCTCGPNCACGTPAAACDCGPNCKCADCNCAAADRAKS